MVIAHAVDQKGVALRVSADTEARLCAIREGTDDSFMSPEELVALAPKEKSRDRADWRAQTGKTARQWRSCGAPAVSPWARLSPDSPFNSQTLALVSRESFGCVKRG